MPTVPARSTAWRRLTQRSRLLGCTPSRCQLLRVDGVDVGEGGQAGARRDTAWKRHTHTRSSEELIGVANKVWERRAVQLVSKQERPPTSACFQCAASRPITVDFPPQPPTFQLLGNCCPQRCCAGVGCVASDSIPQRLNACLHNWRWGVKIRLASCQTDHLCGCC